MSAKQLATSQPAWEVRAERAVDLASFDQLPDTFVRGFVGPGQRVRAELGGGGLWRTAP